MRGSGEQPLRARRVDRGADPHAGKIVEARIDERHHRIQPARRRPFPRLFHCLRVGDGDAADGAGGFQRLPSHPRLLIVRGQCAGNRGRSSGDVDRDLALEIEAGEIVVPRVRRREAVAGEDQRRLDRRRQLGTQVDGHVSPEAKDVLFAIAHQRDVRFVLDDAPLREGDALGIAFRSGRLQPGLLEFGDDVGDRRAVALASGLPSLQPIVGKRLDVVPPARLVVAGRLRSLGHRDHGHERGQRHGGAVVLVELMVRS